MPIHLKKFNPSELILNAQEAMNVLNFFWNDSSITSNQLTPKDIAFAQALLVEAVDSSAKMWWIQTLWSSVANPSGGLKKAIRKFARKALKRWFTHASSEEIKEAEIYVSVKNTIARNFKTCWELRKATGNLDY